MALHQKSTSKGISSWPEDERPRERLLSRGPNALTNAELLAILLRVGMRGKSAVQLGRELLERFGSLQAMMSAPLAVLNDEAHHVANESESKTKKWKDFLMNQDYGFGYIVGVSGTCYIGNEYFADVIFRYSLRQAIEERYVKKVKYVVEMPRTGDPDEKWQLIRNLHEETRHRLKKYRTRPLTIIVTPTIAKCKDVAEELRAFLIEHVGNTIEETLEQILVVYNNAPGVAKLPYIDNTGSKVEWVVAVSMLNEGWDVKRVFQIVPHEERAFNSKLLIAQVLGRGLRVPIGWKGEQPEVTVFNHDAWAPRIQHLVNEILDIVKRISSNVVVDSPFHVELHNIDYTLIPTSQEKTKTGAYNLFEQGFLDLATESAAEDVSIEFVTALSEKHSKWQTTIQRKTYSPNEIALEMYRRLEEIQDPDDPDPAMRTIYTDRFPVEKLEQIVNKSLQRLKTREATESMKQKFLQALGTLLRKKAEYVRYTPKVDRYFTISTRERQADSASAAELRNTKTLFYTDQTRNTLLDEQAELFDEVVEPGSNFKQIRVANHHDFKTPLNCAVAEFENEKRFINFLVRPENLQFYDTWIKSTSTRFYEIAYAWKKREHPKRGKFSPDLFIKAGNLILVIEIKGEEELQDPSEENRKKNEYALAHFERVNKHLEEEGSPLRYKFNFLTERNFNRFFEELRKGRIEEFRSEMDVKLKEQA